MPSSTERLNLSIETTSGEMHAQVDVPTGFIPMSDIVPVLRSLGEQAQALEVSNTLQSGKTISCQKGCGACCRQMIPVSPPEAFVLIDGLHSLPPDQQERIRQKLNDTKAQLRSAGLLGPLQGLADSPHQHSDDELESFNRAYYALRLPCIFLEDEACSIYAHRPAGCRSHLVTSPPELCQDMVNNPIEELHVPLRAGTVLSILWSDLTKGPVRLMPLPIAFEWAEQHQDLNTRTWNGSNLFHKSMDGLATFLQHTRAALANRNTKK